MPNMGDLALKNKAGTDVIATALTPSAGDSVAARWRIEHTDRPPSMRGIITCVAKNNKSGAQRQVEWTLTVPRIYENANTGLPESDAFVAAKVVLFAPQAVDTNTVNDSVAYLRTLLATSLAISVNEAQIAPT